MNAFPRPLFAGFISLVAAALLAPAACAQTVSPNPAPTIITTAPYTITKPGYYQLGKDLYYAGNGNYNDAIITVAASNVTLDFAGHYISGPSNNANSNLTGVYAYEKGNLVIRNGTVAYCFYGIFLDGSSQSGSLNINQRVDNMLVTYCFYTGVIFGYASNSEVTNCRISFITAPSGNHGAAGIFNEFGTGNEARNNTITNVTASGNGEADGIVCDENMSSIGNAISNVKSGTNGTTYGLYQPLFAISNRISNCQIGIFQATKYQGNVTTGCATPFSGGTAAGYENN